VELFVGREVPRAGSTSLRASFTVSPLGEYLGSCFGFCVGGAVLLVVLFCWVTGINWYSPFFAFRMHKVVIHSKTVTIVMMSAAQEQKKSKVSSRVWNVSGHKQIAQCNTDMFLTVRIFMSLSLPGARLNTFDFHVNVKKNAFARVSLEDELLEG